VDYVLTSDRDNPLRTRFSGSNDDTIVSDYSNVNYDFMKYSNINDVGKQWIRKYTLALSKELLGIIRSKYGNIPIPNAEVSLDGETLRAEATAEKEQLIEQLRENLEQTSRKALLEAQKDESDFQQETLRKVPYPIYIG
jgi:C4-type Zn-finger protein